MGNRLHCKNPEQKEFIKILRSIDYSKRDWEIFYDFCEMSARALALHFYPEMMVEPLKTLHEKYGHEKLVKFDKAFTLLVESLDKDYHDFLGDVFQAMELSNKWKGQFFTPFHVCMMMAKVSLGDMESQLKEKPYVTINDPACGAGALLIAAIRVIIENKGNPSQDAYFVAQDIDRLSFFMSYIQLSLCGAAGEVIWGNSLLMKIWETWKTPVAFTDIWQYRILLNNFRTVEPEKIEQENKPREEEQITLF